MNPYLQNKPFMKQVFSSHIFAIGYNLQTSVLYLDFKNGSHAVYLGVPYDTAQKVIDSPSIGQSMHRYIRGKFKYGYIPEDK